MPIAPSRACEWCIGSTWCHLSGFYGLEELTNLRYIHIIYNLNCPESQLLASPYLREKGLCGSEDAEPFYGLCSRAVQRMRAAACKLLFNCAFGGLLLCRYFFAGKKKTFCVFYYCDIECTIAKLIGFGLITINLE